MKKFSDFIILLIVFTAYFIGCAHTTSSQKTNSKNKITAVVKSKSNFIGIDTESGKKVINDNMYDITKCYQLYLLNTNIHEALQGILVYKLNLTGNGFVGSVNRMDSTIDNSDLEACVESIIANCKFPAPNIAKGTVKLELSFYLMDFEN